MKQLPPCHGIIPARYGSTRFPAKALADIGGKPMFWHVWKRACGCGSLLSVTLATDDERIAAPAAALGVPCVLTSPLHQSGTDRVCEAAGLLGLPDEAVIVNIQGDEPLLAPEMLNRLIEPFTEPGVRAATLARPITPAEAASPDQVKVVLNRAGDALYFSRSPIPYDREKQLSGPDERNCAAQNAANGGHNGTALLDAAIGTLNFEKTGKAGNAESQPDIATYTGYLGHIGLYAFRHEALRAFTALPPSRLESLEKLEQLRLLENGTPIRVSLTNQRSIGVDRPEDLERVLALIEKNAC